MFHFMCEQITDKGIRSFADGFILKTATKIIEIIERYNQTIDFEFLS